MWVRHHRRAMARALGSRLFLAALLPSVLVAVGGCGGSGAGDPADVAAVDPGPEHVHGLGVDPADGALLVATHTGLFRVARNTQDYVRIGDGRQDTMGFVVTGPHRFLGSGHPDLDDNLPPLLGLIESSDAGRSWQPVSLLGTADFHVLRARGAQVVGYEASRGRLMVSADGGRTWRSSMPPSHLADLVVDPADPARFVAASADGLIRSSDAGRTWSAMAGPSVALAWPAPRALYAFEADGSVWVSADGGSSWTARTALPGAPAAVTAVVADSVIVALHDGTFASSTDGGRSWSSGPWAQAPG
jgi:hypothetical protein